MASMLATGLSFVVFFMALGLVYLVADYIIAVVLTAIPITTNPYWAEQRESITELVRIVMLLVLPATFTFATMKLLINASHRGRD